MREGADRVRLASELEGILSKEFGFPIHVRFRDVERQVYVASGTYELNPFRGEKAHGTLRRTDTTVKTDIVHVFGAHFVPDSGSGGGTDDFGAFLKAVGNWIDVPIVDETENKPSRQISWHYHGRSPFTEAMRREDHDPVLVLNNVTAQTGLKFELQTREIRVLAVERAN